MLESCKNAQERFFGVHKLIDNWLLKRHELVKAYDAVQSEIHGLNPKRGPQKEFCGVLMDYMSAGHFEIYEQLTAEANAFGDKRALVLANQIYPRIDKITERAVDFNDRCDNGDCRDGAGLAAELQRLGQQLHERFELEDCLIEVLHNAHSQVGAV